jgi:hypothetical protein
MPELTEGVQVVSEYGSMIHEDSSLRTIGHTISRRAFSGAHNWGDGRSCHRQEFGCRIRHARHGVP